MKIWKRPGNLEILNMKRSDVPELNRCIRAKLEHAATTPINNILGKKLFIKEQLELTPFKETPFSTWDNWEQDPLKNRSWQWRLNWLSFLPYLMAYHYASKDDNVLDFAKKAIFSWLDKYLATDTSYPFEFIWHDHATALRAEQLVFFAYYSQIYAPIWANEQKEFLTYLQYALEIHGEWLARDDFYSEHTNHGLEQARVLLLLGTIFKDVRGKQWQQIGVERIKNELNFSFTAEGVHVENSPAYHVFVFKLFLGIINDYPEEVLGNLNKWFNQFSVKALDFITHILRPDGLLPPIGDTEQLPTSDAYRERFGHTSSYQEFIYAQTMGCKGIRPSVLNRVYAQSGYAIFRDRWPKEQKDFNKIFHLIVKAGCSSRYHHQQDEGHISLYAGGEDWLIDSGLYNYINADPIRRYMRSRSAHNVPLISHASYADNFEHRLKAWKITDFSESQLKPFVEMRFEVMPPVIHERRVDFDVGEKIVTVMDRVTAADELIRSITLLWHFPEDKEIIISNDAVKVVSPSGNKLFISFDKVNPDRLNVMRGWKKDRVFSCISYKVNQVKSSQVLQVAFTERDYLTVRTCFRFELVTN